jgi:hypothetical protein
MFSEREKSEPVFPGFLTAVGQNIAGGDEVAEDESGTYAQAEDGRVDHQIIHGNSSRGDNRLFRADRIKG